MFVMALNTPQLKRMARDSISLCEYVIDGESFDCRYSEPCRYCGIPINSEHKVSCLFQKAVKLMMRLEDYLVELENLDASK